MMLGWGLLSCVRASDPGASPPATAWARPKVPDACEDIPARRAKVAWVGVGDPGGDGSWERPWGSLKEALDQVQPDTELRLAPGRHSRLLLDDPARHRALSIVGCEDGVEVDTLFVVVGTPGAAITDIEIVGLTARAPIETRWANAIRLTDIAADNGHTGHGLAFRYSQAEVDGGTLRHGWGSFGVLATESQVTLTGVDSQGDSGRDQPSQTGLWCEGSSVLFRGVNSFVEPAESFAELYGKACDLTVEGSVASSGAEFGWHLFGSSMLIAPGGSVEILGAGSAGFTVDEGSSASIVGELSIVAGAHAVQVVDGSSFEQQGIANLVPATGFSGLLVSGSSATIAGATTSGSVIVGDGASVVVAGALTVDGLAQVEGSTLELATDSLLVVDGGELGLNVTDGATVSGPGALEIRNTTGRGIQVVDSELALTGPVGVWDTGDESVWCSSSEVSFDALTVERSADDSVLAFGGSLVVRHAVLAGGANDGFSVHSGGTVALEDVTVRDHGRAALLMSDVGGSSWAGGTISGNSWAVVEQDCLAPALIMDGVAVFGNADDTIHQCDGTTLVLK